MKNKLTRKLMLSAFTLLFAVISLGASTYAWFTMSKDASVAAFQGTVGTGISGLEICATPLGVADGNETKNWKSTTLNLTASDQLGSLLDNVKFSPVQIGNQSATFTESFMKIDGTTEADENLEYIAFELHFKLSDDGDKATKKVYLKDYSIFTDSPANPWYVNHEYTLPNETTPINSGTTVSEYYVSDAAYVALVGTNSYVLETEEFTGEGNYATVGKQQLGAWDYYTKVETDNEVTFPANYLSSNYNVNNKLANAASYPELCELNESNGYEAKVKVYVWIDGWDGECLNAIFTQVLQVSFDFTTEQKN